MPRQCGHRVMEAELEARGRNGPSSVGSATRERSRSLAARALWQRPSNSSKSPGRRVSRLQTLADRANLSLRTFYQHFAGKDELLLALYEDVTAQFTEAIREKVEAADGPMGQLEAWCRGVLSRPGSSQEVGGRLVLIYNLSLEMNHPEAFAKGMGAAPQAVDRDFDGVLADEAPSGVISPCNN